MLWLPNLLPGYIHDRNEGQSLTWLLTIADTELSRKFDAFFFTRKPAAGSYFLFVIVNRKEVACRNKYLNGLAAKFGYIVAEERSCGGVKLDYFSPGIDHDNTLCRPGKTLAIFFPGGLRGIKPFYIPINMCCQGFRQMEKKSPQGIVRSEVDHRKMNFARNKLAIQSRLFYLHNGVFDVIGVV